MKQQNISRIVILVMCLSLGGFGVSGCSENSSSSTGQAAGDPQVATEGLADPQTNAPVAHPGEEIYQTYCFSCHTPGLSGAPKLGDAEAWAPRIAKGDALLLKSTLEGMGSAMPAKGMCFDCTDEQLRSAVDYMVSEGQ